MKFVSLNVSVNDSGRCGISFCTIEDEQGPSSTSSSNNDQPGSVAQPQTAPTLELPNSPTAAYPHSRACDSTLKLNVDLNGHINVNIVTNSLSAARMSWPLTNKAASPVDISDADTTSTLSSVQLTSPATKPRSSRVRPTVDRLAGMDLLSRLEELEKAHDDASRAEPSDASSKAKASRKAVATNEKTGNGHSKNGGSAKKPPKKPPTNKRSGPGRSAFSRMAKVF